MTPWTWDRPFPRVRGGLARTGRRLLSSPDLLVGWLGLLAATGLATWETRSAWGSRAPSGQDTMALLVRTQVGLRDILAHGHLDGWLPNFALGYQEFLFYGPGQTLAIGAVHVASLGIVSVAGSFKVVAVASFVIFPLSVAWLARSLGLSQAASGVAAVGSLLVDSPYGVGLQAIFENSFVAQQLGATCAFVVLGGVCRLLSAPSRRRLLGTAVAFAALLVTHIISTVILGFLVAIICPTLLFTGRPKRRALVAVVAAGALGVGLAGFWLVPALAHRNLAGTVATWGTPPLPDRLNDIWKGRFLFPPHVAQIVVAGWAYGLYRVTRNQPWAVGVLFGPAAFVIVARVLLHRYPHNGLTIQLENRGIGMAAVIATFPLAGAIDALARRLGQEGQIIAVAGAAILVTATLGALAKVPQQMPPGTPAVQAAATELGQVVPVGSRWVEVREFPGEQDTTGLVHPDFWLAAESGRWTADEFNPESSTPTDPTFVSYHLLDRSPDRSADALARLGVTFVVTTTPTSYGMLTRSARFDPVWREGGIAILAVRAPAGQPAPASLVSTNGPASASLQRASGDHLVVRIVAGRATQATVAVAWSPKWHVVVDGHPARLGRTSDGLIRVAVPPGVHLVGLTFSADEWDWLGDALTVLSLLAVVALVSRRVRVLEKQRLVVGIAL